jgi:hypothetical protein
VQEYSLESVAEVHEFTAPFFTAVLRAVQAVQDFLSAATKYPGLQAVVVASVLFVQVTAPALALVTEHAVHKLLLAASMYHWLVGQALVQDVGRPQYQFLAAAEVAAAHCFASLVF